MHGATIKMSMECWSNDPNSGNGSTDRTKLDTARTLCTAECLLTAGQAHVVPQYKNLNIGRSKMQGKLSVRRAARNALF
jgi:hypothetical protein